MTNLTTHRGGLLAALLGPGEPELTCKQCFEQLGRYVELQLTAVDADAAVPGYARICSAVRPAATTTKACANS